jgi:hypothetical protein
MVWVLSGVPFAIRLWAHLSFRPFARPLRPVEPERDKHCGPIATGKGQLFETFAAMLCSAMGISHRSVKLPSFLTILGSSGASAGKISLNIYLILFINSKQTG